MTVILFINLSATLIYVRLGEPITVDTRMHTSKPSYTLCSCTPHSEDSNFLFLFLRKKLFIVFRVLRYQDIQIFDLNLN